MDELRKDGIKRMILDTDTYNEIEDQFALALAMRLRDEKISLPKCLVLISGFSPNILSMVMSDQTDPWLALKDKLDSKRYICVSDTLKNVRIND